MLYILFHRAVMKNLSSFSSRNRMKRQMIARGKLTAKRIKHCISIIVYIYIYIYHIKRR